jgi:hypothetical protein
MPINRIPYGEALPVSTQDYVRQNNLLETGFLRVNDPWPVVGGNIVQGAVFQIGGTVYLCTAATAIGGVPSNYVKLTPSGDGSTCAADYVANLAGVSWNSAFNGYYDIGGNYYVFNEMTALIAGEIAAVRTRLGNALNTLLGLNLTFNGDNTFNGIQDVNGRIDSYCTNRIAGGDEAIAAASNIGVTTRTFEILKPVSAWIGNASDSSYTVYFEIYQNAGWRIIYTDNVATGVEQTSYNYHLNPGYYRLRLTAGSPGAFIRLVISGVYGQNNFIDTDPGIVNIIT